MKKRKIKWYEALYLLNKKTIDAYFLGDGYFESSSAHVAGECIEGKINHQPPSCSHKAHRKQYGRINRTKTAYSKILYILRRQHCEYRKGRWT